MVVPHFIIMFFDRIALAGRLGVSGDKGRVRLVYTPGFEIGPGKEYPGRDLISAGVSLSKNNANYSQKT